MDIYIYNMTIFLGLIALVSGVYLFAWSSHVENTFYKVIAWILGLLVTISAILGLICVVGSSMKYKREGMTEKPGTTRMMEQTHERE